MKKLRKLSICALIVLTFVMAFQFQASAAPKISKKKITLEVGNTFKLKVKKVPKKQKIKWKSSKKSVAAVSKKGVVTGKSAGSAVITATVNKKKLVCRVTVTNNARMSLNALTLRAGDTYTLSVTGTKAKVTWSSSAPKIASVNASGVVKGEDVGTATISALAGGTKFSCAVTVKKDEKKSGTGTGSSSRTSTQNSSNPTIIKEGDKDNTENEDNPAAGLSDDEAVVYRRLIAMKSKYPERMPYTNADYYSWKGGFYRGGYGCAGFTFLMSDAAFKDDITAEIHTDFDKIRVGDIIRTDNNTHSVIALQVTASYIIVAEGNYNKSIHWGRKIYISELKRTASYVMTRWPNYEHYLETGEVKGLSIFEIERLGVLFDIPDYSPKN